MTHFVRVLVAILAIAFLNSSALAEVRKPPCLVERLLGIGKLLVMVDGKVLGEYSVPPERGTIAKWADFGIIGDNFDFRPSRPLDPAGMSPAARAYHEVDPADVLGTALICVAVPENDMTVWTNAISVITRTGAPEVLTRYLSDLVTAQETYRLATGSYAGVLEQVDFYTARHPVRMLMTTSGGGWIAKAKFRGGDAVCGVEGGESSREIICSSS